MNVKKVKQKVETNYARAYQYRAWKPVQNQWGKTFANADVQIRTQVEIKSVGVME